MGQYDQIIEINLTDAAQGVSITGFGTTLILSPNATFSTTRTKTYTEAGAELAADLDGGTASEEYAMAQAIFSQSPAPSSIKLGRMGEYETAVEAIDAIRAEDDDWYFIEETTHDKATVLLIAAKVETLEKVFLTSSGDTDIVDLAPGSDTTTLAHDLKVLGYNRTLGIFGGDADSAPSAGVTPYNEAALAGYLGAQDKPGSYSAAFKTLVGQNTDALTPTQEANILGTAADPSMGKYFNAYEYIGGGGVFRYGFMSSGKYVDYIIFKDWLKARLQEALFGLLRNVPKIPEDLEGLTMINNSMEPVFKLGQSNGAIPEMSKDDNGIQNGGYVITMPDLSIRSGTDKTARRLTGIGFKCWYTDGIHTMKIDGVIN
jgi:hypothetical protein